MALTTDTTTKTLLGAIAIGLWLNFAVQFLPNKNFFPSPNDAKLLRSIDDELSSIESSVGDIGELKEKVDSTNDSISSVADGTCTNTFLCH